MEGVPCPEEGGICKERLSPRRYISLGYHTQTGISISRRVSRFNFKQSQDPCQEAIGAVGAGTGGKVTDYCYIHGVGMQPVDAT